MGRHERAAKTTLKEATALAIGIIDSVRHDLRREEVRLEEEMRDRVEAVQSILNEVASIQDAIDNASSGDVLQLWEWDYVEYGIEVTERVTILGNSSKV